MNATLIAYDDDLAGHLTALVRDAVQASALTLNPILLRQPGEALAPLLHVDDTGILVLQSRQPHAAMDLQALAQVTREHPQLQVIMLCDDDSKAWLMQAMRVGVREVLPLNPSPAELTSSLQRWSGHPLSPQPALADKGQAQGQVVVFMGCKGGTGTSFVAANMAWLTATDFERHSLFIDLDLQSGDASFYLSSGTPKNDLSDLTRQIDRLDAQLLSSCLHPVTERLDLLAAPDSPQEAMRITPQAMAQILALARQSHQDVVVDVGRTLNAVTLQALDMADQMAIVMHNTTPDVRDAQRLVKTLLALGYRQDRLRLIVNRYVPDGWVSLKELEKAVGIPVSHTLPDNPRWVGESVHWGKPLALVNNRNALIQALRDTTAGLLQTPVPLHSGWLSRWMGKVA